MQEEYTGILGDIIFHNNENGYTVAVFETDDDAFTIVGNIPMASVGRTYVLRGEFVEHPNYGVQFKVLEFAEHMPSTEEGIREFLSSGAVKGVGRKTAAAMIKEFGEDTLRVIEEEPEKLTRISGIGPKTAKKISVAFAEQREFARISLELQQYGIGAGYALKLYKVYGAETVEILKENPYQLIDDVFGIGFKKADEIAEKMGLERSDPFRIQSGIRYVLNQNAGRGHTCYPQNDLCMETSQLIEIPTETIRENLEVLAFSGDIHIEIIEGRRVVYLMAYYLAEQNICRKLRILKETKPKPISGSIDRLIRRTEVETGIALSDNQKHTVETSLGNGVSVITGGPGTGKTTIINSIIEILHDSGIETAIAAPTGRAAKRITETSGHAASTIHRLLEYSYSESDDMMHFGRTEDNPLDQEAVIVDEASMIDLQLMDALVSAIRPGTRFIIVGDDDQLPSVGAGNVLRDIIASEYIYCNRLTKIFRQDNESMIVVNAHRINRGEYPYYNDSENDFFVIQEDNENDMLKTIISLCLERLPRYYDNLSPVRDIQVLTPMRKNNMGSINLNVHLQNVLNPPDESKEEKRYGEKLFREGDKVMQIRNNYEIKWRDSEEFTEGEGVFNGDVGFISRIDHEYGQLIVVFDGTKYVEYPFAQLDELELAYAVTVHKSQGSEFPIVIMPLTWFPEFLANRNLLYTAVTRGKTAVILVGVVERLKVMVDNDRINERYSGLQYRLRELLRIENDLRG